jgi:putative acetyltransferase
MHHGRIVLRIRPEAPADVDAIRRVNEAAFGQPDEARLVDALRDAARPFLSFVAEEEGEIVGHICFTPVEVGERVILGLAPMAVVPARQREGIGSRLVERGLEACGDGGFQAVVVLGHPEYYPRFAFTPAARYGIRSEYDVPEEAFMLLELVPGAAAELRGVVRYHPVFAAFV